MVGRFARTMKEAIASASGVDDEDDEDVGEDGRARCNSTSIARWTDGFARSRRGGLEDGLGGDDTLLERGGDRLVGESYA